MKAFLQKLRAIRCRMVGHDFAPSYYRSSSGRKLCKRCGYVTEKPFDTLDRGSYEKRGA